ncbi:hypothetical protein DMUE_5017, partial [Dictyocoela muelleri]
CDKNNNSELNLLNDKTINENQIKEIDKCKTMFKSKDGLNIDYKGNTESKLDNYNEIVNNHKSVTNEQVKKDDVKKDDVKNDEVKKGEVKNNEVKKGDVKKNEVKNDELSDKDKKILEMRRKKRMRRGVSIINPADLIALRRNDDSDN